MPASSSVAKISSKCARLDSMISSPEGSSSRKAEKPEEGATRAPSPSRTFRMATMYLVASSGRIAGRSISACSCLSSAMSRLIVNRGRSSIASTRSFACTTYSSRSTQCARRSPVSALRMTVGDSALMESSILSGVASPSTVAPGKCVIAAIPGEKPSISLNAPDFVCTPFRFEGIVTSGSARRSPVTVVASATVQ